MVISCLSAGLCACGGTEGTVSTVTESKTGNKTASFRSFVGDNYESASGKAQWRISDMGDVVFDNMTPFEGMTYGYGFIPRFSAVDAKEAPNHEEGLISLEYMEGCVYFKKMEESDPFEGVDLANASRLKEALEESRRNGQETPTQSYLTFQSGFG